MGEEDNLTTPREVLLIEILYSEIPYSRRGEIVPGVICVEKMNRDQVLTAY